MTYIAIELFFSPISFCGRFSPAPKLGVCGNFLYFLKKNLLSGMEVHFFAKGRFYNFREKSALGKKRKKKEQKN